MIREIPTDEKSKFLRDAGDPTGAFVDEPTMKAALDAAGGEYRGAVAFALFWKFQALASAHPNAGGASPEQHKARVDAALAAYKAWLALPLPAVAPAEAVPAVAVEPPTMFAVASAPSYPRARVG